MATIGQTFEGLPGWAKGAIAVGGLAITALIGFTIYNKVKKIGALRKERQEGRDVDAEIKKLNIKPTLTQAQLSIMADQLKVAFDGSGTDRAAVYNILSQLNNEADALMLIKTYGIRTINSGYGFNDFKGTLAGTIINEIDLHEITGKSRTDINEMLTKKGIKFAF